MCWWQLVSGIWFSCWHCISRCEILLKCSKLWKKIHTSGLHKRNRWHVFNTKIQQKDRCEKTLTSFFFWFFFTIKYLYYHMNKMKLYFENRCWIYIYTCTWDLIYLSGPIQYSYHTASIDVHLYMLHVVYLTRYDQKNKKQKNLCSKNEACSVSYIYI